jgi:hypothetical protein
LQREISIAADDAAREYQKNTRPEERTPNGISEAMKESTRKFVKAVKGNFFDKYLSVANPANGEDFMKEVR